MSPGYRPRDDISHRRSDEPQVVREGKPDGVEGGSYGWGGPPCGYEGGVEQIVFDRKRPRLGVEDRMTRAEVRNTIYEVPVIVVQPQLSVRPALGNVVPEFNGVGFAVPGKRRCVLPLRREHCGGTEGDRLPSVADARNYPVPSSYQIVLRVYLPFGRVAHSPCKILIVLDKGYHLLS